MRLWIYQANRRLRAAEEEKISQHMQDFVQSWQAHGQDLRASFELRGGYFLILQVDEQVAMASGCSIDASVRWIKEMQQTLGLDFFNRQNIVYELDGQMNMTDLDGFIQGFEEGRLQLDTPVYNVALSESEDLATKFRIPASESWIKRFLKPKAAKA